MRSSIETRREGKEKRSRLWRDAVFRDDSNGSFLCDVQTEATTRQESPPSPRSSGSRLKNENVHVHLIPHRTEPRTNRENFSPSSIVKRFHPRSSSPTLSPPPFVFRLRLSFNPPSNTVLRIAAYLRIPTSFFRPWLRYEETSRYSCARYFIKISFFPSRIIHIRLLGTLSP